MGRNIQRLGYPQGWVTRSAIGCLLSIILFTGCTSLPSSYKETYEIRNLTIVFLDEASLQKEWTSMKATSPIRFQHKTNADLPMIRTLRGFYDSVSYTLYCPKWNFETCGHELHHAVLGPFHPTE